MLAILLLIGKIPKTITPQTTTGQASGAELSCQAFDKPKRVIVGGLPVGKLGE